MLDELIARYQFPVPESFVQQQVDARLERGSACAGAAGDEGRRTCASWTSGGCVRRSATRRSNEVKASLILDRIAEAEGVTVTDEELDRELLMLSIQSREPLETLRERLSKDGGLDRIREQMRREKTGSVLYEKLARRLDMQIQQRACIADCNQTQI